MKHLKLIGFILAVVFSCNAMGQETSKNEDPNTLLFHADSLIAQLKSQDKRWISFLQAENVLTGIYHIKSGEQDMQKPHDTDEVYYVIDGKAKFIADNKVAVVSKGSILFVKAEVAHRFTEIEEDLVVLVFFDQ